MTDKREGRQILDAMDNVTPEKWKKIQESTRKGEEQSDEWLKGLLDEHDRSKKRVDDDNQKKSPELG